MNSTCNCSELKARVTDPRRIEDQVVGPPSRAAPSDNKAGCWLRPPAAASVPTGPSHKEVAETR